MGLQQREEARARPNKPVLWGAPTIPQTKDHRDHIIISLKCFLGRNKKWNYLYVSSYKKLNSKSAWEVYVA